MVSNLYLHVKALLLFSKLFHSINLIIHALAKYLYFQKLARIARAKLGGICTHPYYLYQHILLKIKVIY